MITITIERKPFEKSITSATKTITNELIKNNLMTEDEAAAIQPHIVSKTLNTNHIDVEFTEECLKFNISEKLFTESIKILVQIVKKFVPFAAFFKNLFATTIQPLLKDALTITHKNGKAVNNEEV